MRVLAVGAHPDDLEILCGGTLARFALDGHDAGAEHVTLGLWDGDVNAADPAQKRHDVEIPMA